jgi:hypothetical protein
MVAPGRHALRFWSAPVGFRHTLLPEVGVAFRDGWEAFCDIAQESYEVTFSGCIATYCCAIAYERNKSPRFLATCEVATHEERKAIPVRGVCSDGFASEGVSGSDARARVSRLNSVPFNRLPQGFV